MGWGCNNYVKLNTTTTQPQKTNLRERKRSKSISHTPHNLSFFPLGLMWTLPCSTLTPPPATPLYLYLPHEAKKKKKYPTQGSTVSEVQSKLPQPQRSQVSVYRKRTPVAVLVFWFFLGHGLWLGVVDGVFSEDGKN
jgi:hypothetical protein